jgi:hypothetical protein
MISTGLQEFYCSATIDYMQSSSSLTVVTVDSLQSAVVTFLLDVCPTWTRGVALMSLQRRGALRRYGTMGYQRV